MDTALSWDEFRLVKAIADSRSLSGAASALGLNHSTVFRRLGALEAAVGGPLFERSRSGYDPTPAGDEMIALANLMADSIVEFERHVAGRDVKPTGRLRVTTVEAVGQRFLPSILAQFHAQNPSLVIDLILSERELNLSRRDADIAIRMTNDPPETLVGRRICAVRWAVYCRRDLAETMRSGPAGAAPFVGFADDFGPPQGRRWIEANVRPEALAARVNSLHVMLEMAVHGFGAAPLPCFLGEPNPNLARLGPALREWDLGLWILTHSDLRRSARVRAFMDFAGAELARHRKTIEGAESEP
jgi:DNA-binding transcriptional LysR family regulator